MQLQIRRRLVQIVSTVLYNANALKPLTVGKGVALPADSVCVPGLNCQFCRYSVAGCPLGITQWAMAGNLGRIAWHFWGLLVLMALLFGRTICGWACPIGFFQEILNKVPLPKLKKNRFTKLLSYLKYLLGAVFVIGLPFYTGYFTARGITSFCAFICPGNLLETAIIPNLLRGNITNLLIATQNQKFYGIMLLLVAMLFIYRPFCRFICPLGAFYGFFNRFAIVGIHVDKTRCVNCGACSRTCKMDTRLAGDHECISCGECISKCPVQAISKKND